MVGTFDSKIQNYTSREIVFSRSSWSPNGAFVVASQGITEDRVFVSPVFARGTWRLALNYVGHQLPTTVARFNPVLFHQSQPAGTPPKSFSVCAVGSMDKSISVWRTNSPKPFAVFSHLFEESVLDISWSSDGLSMMACSHDGQIVFVRSVSHSIGLRSHWCVVHAGRACLQVR